MKNKPQTTAEAFQKVQDTWRNLITEVMLSLGWVRHSELLGKEAELKVALEKMDFELLKYTYEVDYNKIHRQQLQPTNEVIEAHVKWELFKKIKRYIEFYKLSGFPERYEANIYVAKRTFPKL